MSPSDEPWMPRVLVVDDSMTRRMMLSDWLHEHHYPTTSARTGRQALEQILDASPDARPDLVVSDVQMPELSGRELRTELQRRPETAEIRVILYTGREASKGRAGDLEAPFHLREAADFERLTVEIERHVQTLRNLRKLRQAREALSRPRHL